MINKLERKQFDAENYIRATRQILTNETITYPIGTIVNWYEMLFIGMNFFGTILNNLN